MTPRSDMDWLDLKDDEAALRSRILEELSAIVTTKESPMVVHFASDIHGAPLRL